MKKGFLLLAALVLLALCGCDGAPEGSTSPSPEPSGPVSAAPEVLTPEELLAQYPMDDGHDAFLVPTGGRLGTLLVTVERGEEDTHTEFNRYQYTLSVWDPADMDAPIQTLEDEAFTFCGSYVMDANFDGYMDLCLQWNWGANNGSYDLYLWDEERGQYAFCTGFLSRGGPHADLETQTIENYTRHSGAGDGETSYYRWEDGELACFRKVEYTYPDEDGMQEKIVYELVDGELTEISRGPFDPMESG